MRAFASQKGPGKGLPASGFAPERQCGASLVESRKGRDALLKYVDACFEHQETYMNAALGDARKSDVDAVFATIAEQAGVLDDAFTKEAFLADLHDWKSAVKPAYAEHKIALGYGVTCRCKNQRRVDGVDAVDRTQVYGTPKHVIDGKLVPDTESAWGAADWAEKLKSL